MKRAELPSRLDGLVQWEGVFSGYAQKWVNRHFWRVSSTLGTKEDALQECALIYVRCFNHYKRTVDNPAWFMSLYKIALVNDWNTMAVADRRYRETVPPPMSDVIDPPLASLAVCLHGASAELQHVLSVIADAPSELLQLMFGSTSVKLTNRRLCRLTGIKYGEADILGELRELLL